jgi:HK97 gp10 family phage protein
VKIAYKYNDNGFARSIKKVRDDQDTMIKKEIAVATRNTSKAAKSFAPVNHSRLKNSIRDNASGMTGEVVASADYAPYVEFGTGMLVNVPDELSSYAMQFKGQGIRQVNTRSQPYLYPAFFINRKKLTEQVDRKMAEIFRKHSIR